MPNSANSSAQATWADAVASLISLQMVLCDLDPVSFSGELNEDEYSLGYLFGIADMGNYQFNRENSDQVSALQFIGDVYKVVLGHNSVGLLEKSIALQSSEIFVDGRAQGAEELGQWIKSNGKVSPLGLVTHFGK